MPGNKSGTGNTDKVEVVLANEASGNPNSNNDSNSSNDTRKSTGNRKFNNYKGKRNNNNNFKKPVTMKFKGKCTELEGYIFDCSGPKQADQYVTTKQEIEEYVGREYKYGTDIKHSLENLKKYDVPLPADLPSNPMEMETLIYNKCIEEYVK